MAYYLKMLILISKLLLMTFNINVHIKYLDTLHNFMWVERNFIQTCLEETFVIYIISHLNS
jgi:hypothetical protein